jgi:cyclase
MKKKRVIPVVLFRDGHVVQSRRFNEFKNLGNPYSTIERLSEWGADEIIFLDISRGENWMSTRVDTNRVVANDFLNVLSESAKIAFMPLSCGGGIRTRKDAESRLLYGADKIVLNKLLFSNPDEVEKMVIEFGSQCVIASIDVHEIEGKYSIFTDFGKERLLVKLIDAMKMIEQLGVGELFINSIARDGSKSGFDLNLIDEVARNSSVPLIVCGGAGTESDFEIALKRPGVDAVAAANYFQHTELSVLRLHSYLIQNGCNVRPPRQMNLEEFK